MATHALPHPVDRSIPRPELHRAGWVTIGFLVLLGIGAAAGGAALVARPDGSVMGFDVALLAGSPFADYLIPGLVLGGLFGVGSLITVVLGLRHARLAPFLALAIGSAAVAWGWPTFQAWRRAR